MKPSMSRAWRGQSYLDPKVMIMKRLNSNYRSSVGMGDELILGRVNSQAYLLEEVVGLELRQFITRVHEKQQTFSAGDSSFFGGFGMT